MQGKHALYIPEKCMLPMKQSNTDMYHAKKKLKQNFLYFEDYQIRVENTVGPMTYTGGREMFWAF
jgi:hypothetical protein